LVRDLVVDGSVVGVHDVADGGLATCLGELVARSGVGLRLGGLETPGDLFAEAASRVVVCAPPGTDPTGFEQRAEAVGVALVHLGEAGGDRLVVDGLVDLALASVTEAWRDSLPQALTSAT
jgi:phosphoribosylformylglycinamidine synthase